MCNKMDSGCHQRQRRRRRETLRTRSRIPKPHICWILDSGFHHIGRHFIYWYSILSCDIFSGLPTEPLKTFVHVRQGQNITVPCSSFGKALTLEEGRFSFLRWYVLTYDGVKPQWTFLAGMNEDGNRSVDGDWYKAFNITRDGGLYIHEAQPCHLQEFRCTVVLRSGRSPLTNYVTLKLGKFWAKNSQSRPIYIETRRAIFWCDVETTP